jgi:hypothetical protein
MKFFQLKWIVLSIGLALLAACSSGGGDAVTAPPPPAARNTLTISNTISPATQAVNVADTSNSIMTAHRNTTENKTIVQICRDVDQDDDCSQLVLLTIDGTTAKNYPISAVDSPSQIVYQDDDAVEGIVNHYLSTSGQINVTRLDSQGIEGWFSATVECNWGCIGTRPISGAFNLPVSQ